MLHDCTIVPKTQESGKPHKRCREYHAAVKRTRKDLQTDPESLQDPMANRQRPGVECWMSDYTIRVESGGIRIYSPGHFPSCPAIRTPHSQCGGPGSSPGQGTKIPHAVGHSWKNKKRIYFPICLFAHKATGKIWKKLERVISCGRGWENDGTGKELLSSPLAFLDIWAK